MAARLNIITILGCGLIFSTGAGIAELRYGFESSDTIIAGGPAARSSEPVHVTTIAIPRDADVRQAARRMLR